MLKNTRKFLDWVPIAMNEAVHIIINEVLSGITENLEFFRVPPHPLLLLFTSRVYGAL